MTACYSKPHTQRSLYYAAVVWLSVKRERRRNDGSSLWQYCGISVRKKGLVISSAETLQLIDAFYTPVLTSKRTPLCLRLIQWTD